MVLGLFKPFTSPYRSPLPVERKGYMSFQFCLIDNRPTLVDQNDQWKPYIYSTEDAFKPRPAADYVVKGILPCPSLSIVYGTPGTMKSFQLADLAVCVATGKPWLEPFNGQPCRSFETKQASIFWLDFENGPLRTHERFEALIKGHKLPKNLLLPYTSMPKPWLDSSDSDSIKKLGDRVERLGTKLLIVDNLGVVIGGTDENSIKMATVMSNWRRLAEDHNMAVILHQTKSYSKGDGTRAGASLRGHSSIEAAIDLALLVNREEQSPVVDVGSTKTRGADVPPFTARFDFTNKPGTDELDEARFYGVPATYSSSTHLIDQAITQTVSENAGINKKDLKDCVHLQLKNSGIKKSGVHKIEEAIDRLHQSGKLEMEIGDKGAKKYSLPEQSNDPKAECIADLQLLKCST
jgi:hypothetical protein